MAVILDTGFLDSGLRGLFVTVDGGVINEISVDFCIASYLKEKKKTQHKTVRTN